MVYTARLERASDNAIRPKNEFIEVPFRRLIMRTQCISAIAVSLYAFCGVFSMAQADELKLKGDVGLGAFSGQSAVRGVHEGVNPFPYIYADYGRAFGRIDTFGVRTFKMGYGNFELIGRATFDGFRSKDALLGHLSERRHSLPLGIGTFQETPIGGFFLYALQDVGQSKGQIFEATYAAELPIGKVTAYPMLGVEHRSAAYNRYYYGVSTNELQNSGLAGRMNAYSPSSATIPQAALLVDIPLHDAWHLNLYGRVKWLPNTLKNSPLVERSTESSVFAAVTYRFE